MDEELKNTASVHSTPASSLPATTRDHRLQAGRGQSPLPYGERGDTTTFFASSARTQGLCFGHRRRQRERGVTRGLLDGPGTLAWRGRPIFCNAPIPNPAEPSCGLQLNGSALKGRSLSQSGNVFVTLFLGGRY